MSLTLPTISLLLTLVGQTPEPVPVVAPPQTGEARPVTIAPEAGRDAEPQAAEAESTEDPNADLLKPRPAAIQSILDTPYFTEDERADLRVRFGLWLPSDLALPARAARAALIAGSWRHPALHDPAADAIDRAEAMQLRGDAAQALEILSKPADATTLRTMRVKAQTLADLGRRAEAIATLATLRDRVMNQPQTDAYELVEGVRGLDLLADLAGPGAIRGEPLEENRSARPDDAASRSQAVAADYQLMLSMLAHAREELDRLCWTAPLVEARILLRRDNVPEALEAVQDSLALNPRSAETWTLLGEMLADRFEFERVESIVARLRALASVGGPAISSPTPKTSSDPADLSLAGLSPWADMLDARAKLRARDADSALPIITAAAERYPTMIPLLAMKAAAQAATFHDDASRATLAKIDELSPGSPEGYFTVGRVLSDMRQYDPSIAALREAARRAPELSTPWIELGLVQMQAGDDAAARVALEKAEVLDPFNVRASNSLRLVRDLAEFQTLENDHFIVRYQPGPDEALAREMLPALQRIFERVTGNAPGGIRHVPDRKTIIELMPDHQWFSVRITGMPKIHTMAAATGPLIAMEAPRRGPRHLVGPYDWARVIQHEYTHTVTLSRTKNRLPHWFTEAAAVYLEDAPRDENTVKLLARAYHTDELLDFSEINFAFVRPRKQTDRALAYAQGAWMYEYIITRFGPAAPLDLMDRYAQGDTEEEAFTTVLSLGREAFMRDFLAYAGEQLTAWGMKLPARTPGLKELLQREAASAQAAAGDDPSELPEPTLELVDRWLAEFPTHPDALELAINLRLQAAPPAKDTRLAPGMIDLLTRYAAARPHAALPHKLLAGDLAKALDASVEEAAEPASRSALRAQLISHLEWLDAREQHASAYALELSRLYRANDEPAKAFAMILRAITINPYDATLRESAAALALEQRKLPAAEHQLRALITLEPDRPVHRQRLEALQKLTASESPR